MVGRVLLSSVDMPGPLGQTVFNLIPVILSISRRAETVRCLQLIRYSSSSIGRDTSSFNPCPFILVQDTFSTLSLDPDSFKNSLIPSSVRLKHQDRFSTSRFGREYTPSSTPTPVMLTDRDKFNSLRLLPDLFNVSIIPWFDNDLQLVSTSFSRLGRVQTISPGYHILRIVTDLRLRWENIVNTISVPSSVLFKTFNHILIVSISSCFLNKSLNTGPQPSGVRLWISNSEKKTY